MAPEAIVHMTAAISIILAFLEPPLANERQRQDLQELRVRQVDQILTGCRLVLQVCGRCKFLQSMHQLWEALSGGLFTLERQLWPEQAPDTPLAFQMPQEPKPLGDLLLPDFEPNVPFVKTALQSLDVFHTWFSAFYNANLHASFNDMIVDTTMLLRSIDTMFRMKQRIVAAGPRAPIDLDATDPPTDPPATGPAAASSTVPETYPMPLTGTDGTPLQWY